MLPIGLGVARERFNGLWVGVEAQRRQPGYPVIDWPTAMRLLAREGVA